MSDNYFNIIITTFSSSILTTCCSFIVLLFEFWYIISNPFLGENVAIVIMLSMR